MKFIRPLSTHISSRLKPGWWRPWCVETPMNGSRQIQSSHRMLSNIQNRLGFRANERDRQSQNDKWSISILTSTVLNCMPSPTSSMRQIQNPTFDNSTLSWSRSIEKLDWSIWYCFVLPAASAMSSEEAGKGSGRRSSKVKTGCITCKWVNPWSNSPLLHLFVTFLQFAHVTRVEFQNPSGCIWLVKNPSISWPTATSHKKAPA